MQRRFVTLNDRLGTFALLQVIFQRRLFHRQRRLRLVNALFIDTVINLEQHLSRFDIIKILHVDGGDIATDLRTDKGGLSAHIGVIGELTVPGKRRQLPGVQNRQYADKADGGGGKK
ncbi:Uncharacterised protein [Raoultella planticola]|uniref:Uncharacterized protein n=1 Tax=Raoultella planticola TaxID=575 RepID=A0A485D6G3_RAOPL|nr:Uncharacterised protein [Raoultella planticola]